MARPCRRLDDDAGRPVRHGTPVVSTYSQPALLVGRLPHDVFDGNSPFHPLFKKKKTLKP